MVESHRNLQLGAVPWERPLSMQNLLPQTTPPVTCSARGDQQPTHLWDMVQFSTRIFYVNDSEGKVILEVIRLGCCRGIVSVKYRTEDSSARGGDQFSHCEGELVFEDNITEQTLCVSLLADETWHKTNYVMVMLFEPKNCALAGPLSVACVKILDAKRFPSEKYRVLQSQGEDGCRAISGPGLFWEYFKLSFRQPGMRWRTFVTLVLDQLPNMFVILKTWMSKYLVDVVFNMKTAESSDRLIFFKGDRLSEAYLMAIFFTLPLVLLHMWDVLKVKIDVEGRNIAFLRGNLVGRYMNFTEQSRQEVNPMKLQVAIMSGAYRLSKGYTALLETARSLGAVAVFLAFAMYVNPGAWPTVVFLMPSIMLLFFLVRAFCIDPPKNSSQAQRALLVFVTEISKNYQVIANYFQRPQMTDAANERINAYRESRLREKLASMNEGYVLQWLGAGCVGTYICVEAPFVLGMRQGLYDSKREVSLGTFLATITIIRELLEALTCLFAMYIQLVDAFNPVRDLTYIFNLPTDVGKRKEATTRRLAMTREARQEAEKRSDEMDGGMQSGMRFPVDDLMLCLEDLRIEYLRGYPVLDDVNLSFEQGQIVAVEGSHGSGKRTLLELIGQSQFPGSGRVFVPGHLHVLQVLSVVQGPLVFQSWSPMENLCFGIESHEIDALRIRTVLGTLLMKKVLKLVEPNLTEVVALQVSNEKAGASPLPETQSPACKHKFNNPRNWCSQLSSTELMGICLARALIANPEVLILHVPFAGFQRDSKMCVKRALLEHQSNRGIGIPGDWQEMRRPRTIIYSVNDPIDCDVADAVWRVSECGVHMLRSRLEAKMQKSEMQDSATISPERSLLASATQSQWQSSAVQLAPLQESSTEVVHPLLQKELQRRITGRENTMFSGSTSTGHTTVRSNSAMLQEHRYENSHGTLLETPQELPH